MSMTKKVNKNMIKRKLWIFLISIMTFLVTPFIFGVSNVFAYRPFVSTDADVAEKYELEIEFGLVVYNLDFIKKRANSLKGWQYKKNR